MPFFAKSSCKITALLLRKPVTTTAFAPKDFARKKRRHADTAADKARLPRRITEFKAMSERSKNIPGISHTG